MGEALPYVRKTKRRKSITKRAKIVALVCGVLAVTLLMSGLYMMQQERVARGAAEAANYTPQPLPEPTNYISFAAVGDSITEANSPDYAGLRTGDASWVHYARGEGVRFVGGWADGGAPTSVMAENVAPVDADVLVLLAGTNDSGSGTPFEVTSANLEAIAASSGAGRVVISSIPPRDSDPAVAVDYNAALQDFATSKGWEFVDAMAGVRSGDTYADGMTSDGIHPTPEASRIIGETIREAISVQP